MYSVGYCAVRQAGVKGDLKFEVRIPACDRPELLERAIYSLQAQIYPRWKAVVYDDSKSQEVSALLDRLRDPRVRYIRNAQTLGAAQNIDQCFSPSPEANGDYGCLLEDDNFWLPGFLKLIATAIDNRGWDLILANQRINYEGEGLRPAQQTTRGVWFAPGEVQPETLLASLLLIEGVSNGGLVWKLAADIDLRVGSTVKQTGLHEACRSLLVRKPFLFIADPEAVWTLIPKHRTARSVETNRVIGRGMQSVREFVIGSGGETTISIAKAMAQRLGLSDQLANTFAYCGRISLAFGLAKRNRFNVLRSMAKGLAIRCVQRDPCRKFLQTIRRNSTRALPREIPVVDAN